MKLRQFKSHEHTQGLAAKTSNAQVSKVMSPMRNTDINRAIASGSWVEMIEKSAKQHQNYLNYFGTNACYCQKKPDGTLLKKGVA